MGLAVPPLRTSGKNASSTSGGACTATTIGDCYPGDVLVVFDGITGGTATPAAPTTGAWTGLTVASDGASCELKAWVRQIPAGEAVGPKSATFAGITSRRHGVIILCFSGAKLPVEGVAEAGENTGYGFLGGSLKYRLIAPALVTDVDKNAIIRAWVTAQTATWASSAGTDVIQDINGAELRTSIAPQNTAGSTGTMSRYTNEDVDYNTLTIALEGITSLTYQATDLDIPVPVETLAGNPHRVHQLTDLIINEDVQTSMVPNRRVPQTHQLSMYEVIDVETYIRPTPMEITATRAASKRRSQKVIPLSNVMGIRVLAQRIKTGLWLRKHMPIHDLEYEPALNGPGRLTGSLKPIFKDLIARDGYRLLEPWGTWFHLEVGRQIWGSFAITEPSAIKNQELSFDAIGFGGYPYDTDFLGTFSMENFDPALIQPAIWEHLEQVNYAPLGVTVEAISTDVRWGLPKRDEDDPTKPEEPDPYQMMPWEFKDSGQEIDNVTKAVPYDWIERTAWNSDKTDVIRWIGRSYPRIGQRKDRLDFIEGQNIVRVVEIGEDPDQYASDVAFVGKGEGSESVYATTSTPHPIRTRRLKTETDKSVDNQQQANNIVTDMRRKSEPLPYAKEIVVDVNAKGARWGSFGLGDEILVRTRDYHQGLWHRIIGMKLARNESLVTIKLLPSGMF